MSMQNMHGVMYKVTPCSLCTHNLFFVSKFAKVILRITKPIQGVFCNYLNAFSMVIAHYSLVMKFNNVDIF